MNEREGKESMPPRAERRSIIVDFLLNSMKRSNNEENKPKPKDPDSDLNCDAADSP